MRVIELQEAFGLDHLKLVDRVEPSAPGAREVVVRMRAASLNYRDFLMVTGRYNARQPLPLIPVSDGSGEVVRVGPGVTRVHVGDRVMPTFGQGWIRGTATSDTRHQTLGGPLDGMLAERVVLSAEGVVPAPERLSAEEAACLPCAGVTAKRR